MITPEKITKARRICRSITPLRSRSSAWSLVEVLQGSELGSHLARVLLCHARLGIADNGSICGGLRSHVTARHLPVPPQCTLSADVGQGRTHAGWAGHARNGMAGGAGVLLQGAPPGLHISRARPLTFGCCARRRCRMTDACAESLVFGGGNDGPFLVSMLPATLPFCMRKPENGDDGAGGAPSQAHLSGAPCN